jgi:nitroreductase
MNFKKFPKLPAFTFNFKTKKMIEILRKRRSIRKYTNELVEPEMLEILKEAVLRSPSSKNIDPWEFIFVTEPETIQKLKDCKPHGATPLATAPLAVVICADKTKNDVWIEDCSIASILLQLTAQNLGLGSCWIQIRNRQHTETVSSEKYIQQLLNIPEKYRILSIITLGYPATAREGISFQELEFGKIRFNSF